MKENLPPCFTFSQPGFLEFFSEYGENAMKSLGSSMISSVATEDNWLLVVRTRCPMEQVLAGAAKGCSRVIAEVASAKAKESRPQLEAVVLIPKMEHGGGCVLDTLKDDRAVKQRHFCEMYEGFGDLCDCSKPFIPWKHENPNKLNMTEHIPVVIVTADKPHHLGRILRNLALVSGSSETQVLVAVDGPLDAAVALAELYGARVRVHRPQGEPRDNTRTNANVGFALWSVFDEFPSADKAILLEDDLLLSPDLLHYFHQLAWLLDADDSVFLVQAFGQHSFPFTACDPARVLRVDSYPQYGWMMSRRTALAEALQAWVPEGPGVDWDWWLNGEGHRKGRQLLAPEVSRTMHGGSAGAHVTGWEQHQYFDSRVFSTSPYTTLRNTHGLAADAYEAWYDDQIRHATRLDVRGSPCRSFLLPSRNVSGPFVVFVGVESRSDERAALRIFQLCLGTDEQEAKEMYKVGRRGHGG